MAGSRCTRLAVHRLSKCVLTLMLGIVSGCAGGLGGAGSPTGGDSQNQNDNGQDGTTNSNDNGGADPVPPPDSDGLTVEIDGVPGSASEIGDSIQISAITFPVVDSAVYTWSLLPDGLAQLSEADSPSPVLSLEAGGNLEINVTVTDLDSGEQAQAQAFLVINAPAEPPEGAAIEAQEVSPANPGDLVILISTVTQPLPDSIEWSPDPDNLLNADALQFVDRGNGTATFTASSLLNFTYDLTFTVTATYSNGTTLSDSVSVTIFGGS